MRGYKKEGMQRLLQEKERRIGADGTEKQKIEFMKKTVTRSTKTSLEYKKRFKLLLARWRIAQSGTLGEVLLGMGMKKVWRTPPTEIYVEGKFTEDREEWQKELQRRCEGA